MPVNKYFKGKGRQVMSDMQGRYGQKKGKSVFYATANKQGKKVKPKHKSVVKTKVCPKCGQKSPQSAAKCKNCGYVFPSGAQKVPPSETRAGKGDPRARLAALLGQR